MKINWKIYMLHSSKDLSIYVWLYTLHSSIYIYMIIYVAFHPFVHRILMIGSKIDLGKPWKLCTPSPRLWEKLLLGRMRVRDPDPNGATYRMSHMVSYIPRSGNVGKVGACGCWNSWCKDGLMISISPCFLADVAWIWIPKIIISEADWWHGQHIVSKLAWTAAYLSSLLAS